MPESQLFLWPDWRLTPDEPGPVEGAEEGSRRGQQGPHYLGMTAEAVGLELGLKRHQVDRIVIRALQRIIAGLADV